MLQPARTPALSAKLIVPSIAMSNVIAMHDHDDATFDPGPDSFHGIRLHGRALSGLKDRNSCWICPWRGSRSTLTGRLLHDGSRAEDHLLHFRRGLRRKLVRLSAKCVGFGLTFLNTLHDPFL